MRNQPVDGEDDKEEAEEWLGDEVHDGVLARIDASGIANAVDRGQAQVRWPPTSP
jgi:hypothetical protein